MIIKKEFYEKFEAWKATWNYPEIIIHSDPRKYTESNEYSKLLEFCRKQGNLISLVFGKFNKENFFIINLLEDLTYRENVKLMDEVKEENKENGISRSLKENWMKYSKKLLSYIKNDHEGNIVNTSVHPENLILNQNFPNPFNPVTQIRFGLPVQVQVSIIIYDILGEEISILVDNEVKREGWHNVIWNGTDKFGNQVASGIYFCKLVTGTDVQTIKLMVMK